MQRVDDSLRRWFGGRGRHGKQDSACAEQDRHRIQRGPVPAGELAHLLRRPCVDPWRALQSFSLAMAFGQRSVVENSPAKCNPIELPPLKLVLYALLIGTSLYALNHIGVLSGAMHTPPGYVAIYTYQDFDMTQYLTWIEKAKDGHNQPRFSCCLADWKLPVHSVHVRDTPGFEAPPR